MQETAELLIYLYMHEDIPAWSSFSWSPFFHTLLHEYYVLNGLAINVDKTKVLVFSRGKISNIPDFNFNGEKVAVIFYYKYLGTVMNYDNRFLVTIKAQCL